MNKYQQHLISDSLKGKVYFHLINFSSENKPLNSQYFFDRLERVPQDNLLTSDELKVKLKDFQRRLAQVISEINEDQINTYHEFVICSCNEGYFIPKTEQGFFKGRNYLMSKIDEQLARVKYIDKMRLQFIYGKDYTVDTDIFSQTL